MELFSILNRGSFAGGNLELFQKMHHRITKLLIPAVPPRNVLKRARMRRTMRYFFHVAVRQCGLLVCVTPRQQTQQTHPESAGLGTGLFHAFVVVVRWTDSTVVQSSHWIREGERRNPRICYAIFEESRQSTAPHRTRDEPDWPLLDIEVGKS